MTDKSRTFILRHNESLNGLFNDLIAERVELVLTMVAGEERDRQIEFIKAFKEWLIVLGQLDPAKQKAALKEKAI